MKTFRRLCALVIALGLFPSASLANRSIYNRGLVDWSAVSTSAIAITGDIALGSDRLVIDDDERSYRLTKIRVLDETETEITARLLGEPHLVRKATLYGIEVPSSAKFRSGNRLCGRHDVTKVIIAESAPGAREAASLGLIFFEGSKEPYFEGWEHTPGGLCGTFHYQQ